VTPVEFPHIAVAVDGSPHSVRALEVAIDLASRYASQLVVVAVAPIQPVYVGPTEPFPSAPGIISDRPRYQKIVESSVAQAQASGVAGATGICLEGVVTDELLNFLDEHPADLLIMGSRGLSTARRILLGSVSTALVTHAPCPVLVVRPPATPRSPG
jgi:nucleotide-binding universal stress UspA family protein